MTSLIVVNLPRLKRREFMATTSNHSTANNLFADANFVDLMGVLGLLLDVDCKTGIIKS